MTTQRKVTVVAIGLLLLGLWAWQTRYMIKAAPEGRGVYKLDRWTGQVVWVFMGKEIGPGKSRGEQ